MTSAAGIVAATPDDADNLSILITARALNPGLFHVVLENGLSSHSLFRAAKPDFIGQPSVVVAGTILSRIASGMTEPFFQSLLHQDNDLARRLLARLLRHQHEQPPELTAGRISVRRTPALARALASGETVTIRQLLTDPRNRERRLPLEVIYIRRQQQDVLWPEDSMPLALGDQLLLAGRDSAAATVSAMLENDRQLAYVLTGIDKQQGWLWQWLERRAG
ncbi:hypothetical protein [Kineobactrum salinum]|uniref:hypothetical protein n=1 Tax=Kineobactrum salinum TaxID=2708301 RepID=UPI001E3A188B|nr:hypothetical protein [Kineobactrum salinum]